MTGSALWFTRATIKSNAPDVAPLINTLLNDDEDGRRLDTTHRLLWTLMPEEVQRAAVPPADAGGKSAFLWRQASENEGPPAWYLLGPRPRLDSAFFEVKSKPWSLALTPGDRLSFDLIVNATVDRMVDPASGRSGRRRVDVVMDAIVAEERSSGGDIPRAALRQKLAAGALTCWWSAQGSRSGFRPVSLVVSDYRTLPLDARRSRGKGRAQLGVSRLKGVVEVLEPSAFTERVATGFGRAKAFGCGLMLLKRAT